MSDDIKSGDMVMLVRGQPCCGGWGDDNRFMRQYHFGYTFEATSVRPMGRGNWKCILCNGPVKSPSMVWDGDTTAFLIERVKKLPPLADEDTHETEREELV